MRGSVVVIAMLAACELQPRVNVVFRAPPRVALDPAKLHIESREAPNPRWYPAYPQTTHNVPGGVDVQIMLSIGPQKDIIVRGWYDANGNGKRDPGEPGGEMGSAIEARDPGGCSPYPGNRAPDVVLVPDGVPSAGRPPEMGSDDAASGA